MKDKDYDLTPGTMLRCGQLVSGASDCWGGAD
jgi:hypothetical protein